jgi:hypothetical protein
MRSRTGLTLPAETVRSLNRAAPGSDRIHLVDRAVPHLIDSTCKARLRKLLKEGAARHRERDALLAEEWLGVE